VELAGTEEVIAVESLAEVDADSPAKTTFLPASDAMLKEEPANV